MNSNYIGTTIAAVATPPGDGGVAIIRLSGPKAISYANAVFSKELSTFESHKLYYGQILNRDGTALDQGMAVVMRAPYSYTGEEVVELHCHGGHFLTKKILHRLFNEGAEVAKPGEFTERAFLNGKLDLAQAEAVQSLIHAKNEYALKFASKQLEGALSVKIKKMQEALIGQAAVLEAWVDFPEEGIEFTTLEEIIAELVSIREEMRKLIDTYDDGQALQEGFSLCLLGRPNVGKSSVMNQLLKRERAIVTPIAGTTRDLLEETLLIDGISYRLMDTAGIRSTDELVEQIGIERAKQSSQKADLVLLVLDVTQELTEEDLKLIELVQNQKVLVVWNKKDLQSPEKKSSPFPDFLEISAKTGEGIEDLLQEIPRLLLNDLALNQELTLTQLRHKKALEEGESYLLKVIDALHQNVSPEWLTFDLKSSLGALSSIMGLDITESILSSIFSKFCIGK